MVVLLDLLPVVLGSIGGIGYWLYSLVKGPLRSAARAAPPSADERGRSVPVTEEAMLGRWKGERELVRGEDPKGAPYDVVFVLNPNDQGYQIDAREPNRRHPLFWGISGRSWYLTWREEGYSTKKYGIDRILPVEGGFDERYNVLLGDRPDGTRAMLILNRDGSVLRTLIRTGAADQQDPPRLPGRGGEPTSTE